jgi:ketosteroid isomerase-like protein
VTGSVAQRPGIEAVPPASRHRPTEESVEPIESVIRFCDAWEDVDLDRIVAFFSDDAVYHNMPLDPATGA